MKKSVVVLGSGAFLLLGAGPGAAIDAQSALSSISSGGSISEIVSSSGGGSASVSVANGGSGFASSGSFPTPLPPSQKPPSHGASDPLILSINDSYLALIGSIEADIESGKQGVLSSLGQ